MCCKRLRLITAFLSLAALVAGLGWLFYAPVRQEQLNHALITAINRDDLPAALSLLTKGADPNARTPEEVPLSPPLAWLTAWRGLQQPSDHGTYQMWPGVPALTLATNEADITELLLKKGANPNATDRAGNTALIWAASEGSRDVVKILLEHGAKVDARGYDRATALIRATERSPQPDAEVIRLLIAKGANVNAQDVNGHTALGVSIAHSHTRIVSLLQQAGAKE